MLWIALSLPGFNGRVGKFCRIKNPALEDQALTSPHRGDLPSDSPGNNGMMEIWNFGGLNADISLILFFGFCQSYKNRSTTTRPIIPMLHYSSTPRHLSYVACRRTGLETQNELDFTQGRLEFLCDLSGVQAFGGELLDLLVQFIYL